MSPILERRESPRYDTSLPFVIYDLADNPLEPEPALRDLSLGGFRLESLRAIKMGERVGFRIELPDHERIQGFAEVRWVKSNDASGVREYGLRIDSIDPGQLRTYRSYIWSRSVRDRRMIPTGLIASLFIAVGLGMLGIRLLDHASLLRVLENGPALAQNGSLAGIIILLLLGRNPRIF